MNYRMIVDSDFDVEGLTESEMGTILRFCLNEGLESETILIEG